MYVKDVEALKSWISKFVAPITDAEPLTFSKYVVALLKKEKPIEELQAICLRDLDIFLNTNTTEFVRELFAALQTESYVESGEEKMTISNNKDKNVEKFKESNKFSKDSNKQRSRDSDQIKDRDKLRDFDKLNQYLDEKRVNTSKLNLSNEQLKQNQNKGDVDLRDKIGWSKVVDDKYKNEIRHSSRKHHNDRDEMKRHRHKDDGRHRGRDDGHRLHHSHRRLKRSHSRHRNRSESPHHSKYKSPSQRSRHHKSKSISPTRGSIRKDATNGSKSQSPNISLHKDARYNIRSKSGNRMRYVGRMRSDFVGNKRSSSQSPTLQPKEFHENKYERSGSVTSESAEEETKHYRHTIPIDQLPSVKICPQFSEKGICMKGPLCQYDHGINPLIIKHNSNNDQIVSYSGEITVDAGCVPPHPQLFLRQPLQQPIMRLPFPGISYLSSNIASVPPNLHQPPPLLRQAVANPPSSISSQPIILTQPPPQPFYQYAILRQPLNSNQMNDIKPVIDIQQKGQSTSTLKDRLGEKVVTSGTSIELINIPSNLNNITSIDQEFKQFGSIINIQVCFLSDLSRALVTFASEDCVERVLAYSQAFFNNRFIQIMRVSRIQENQRIDVKRPVKDRLGIITPIKYSPKPNIQMDRQVVLTSSTSKIGEQQLPNRKAMKKVNHKIDLNKEVLKRKLDLNRQRSLLLSQNCQKIKDLVRKAEEVSALQRNSIKEQIKELYGQNEKLQMEISSDASYLKSPPNKFNKNSIKQQLDRAILDAELDLISGNDSPQLRNKIAALKLQASSLKSRSIASLKRGGFQGRYRGNLRSRSTIFRRNIAQKDFISTKHLLDRRTKKLLVQGFTPLNKNIIQQHFMKLGKVESENDNSMIVTFSNRFNAELALQSGGKVGDEVVQLSWFGSKTPLIGQENIMHTSPSSPDLDPDDHTMIELIIEDDDDEDDEENDHDPGADEYDEYALLGQNDDN